MTILHLTGPEPSEPSALIANGLVGLRLPQLAGSGECWVAGLFRRETSVEVAKMSPAPFPLGWIIGVNGDWSSNRPDALRVIGQDLDTTTGEFASRWCGSLGGRAVAVETLTWCSRTLPSVAAQEVALTMPTGGKIVIQAVIAAGGIPGHWQRRAIPDVDGWDHMLLWYADEGRDGKLGIALGIELTGDGRLLRRWRVDRTDKGEQSMTCLEVELPPGATARMRQLVALVPSHLHPEPEWQAARLLGAAHNHGFAGLRKRDRSLWADIVRTRPRLHGAPSATQTLIDVTHHLVHAHVHQAVPLGLAGYGLGGTPLYGGHIFPSDALMLTRPWVDLSDPGAARALCDSVIAGLPQARSAAALRGQTGAFFSWSSCLDGAETNKPYYSSTHHVSQQPIVALACLHHAQATGDMLWRREVAWPVIQAVARWGESAWRDGHLNKVCGFNESIGFAVDDPVLAALGMRKVFAAAVVEAQAMGFVPPRSWARLATEIFVPSDPSGALREHSSWSPPAGRFEPHCLLPLFPLNARTDSVTEAATYARDLALMRPGIVRDEWCVWPWLAATWAARGGDRTLAAACIDDTADVFAPGVWHGLREIRCDQPIPSWRSNEPYFVTGGGSLLTSVGLGMTGLEPGDGSPETWAVHAPALPAGWEAIEIDLLWLHGDPWRLRAAPGMTRAELVRL